MNQLIHQLGMNQSTYIFFFFFPFPFHFLLKWRYCAPWSNMLIFIYFSLVVFVSTLAVFPNIANEWHKCLERVLEMIYLDVVIFPNKWYQSFCILKSDINDNKSLNQGTNKILSKYEVLQTTLFVGLFPLIDLIRDLLPFLLFKFWFLR